MNTSSSYSSSSSGESYILSSSSNCLIRAPAPIVPLQTAHESESILVNDIPFVLAEKDIKHLHDQYHISRVNFRVYAPSPSICVND